MGELIKVERHEITEVEDQESRIVSIDLTSADKGKAAALINQVVDCYQILKEKLPEVEPEKRYYLDLTKEMKDKLEKGECWFTEKAANGKPMGQLRHRIDGKNVIMANPDVVVENVPVASKTDPRQLSEGVYQMALQQQIAEMSQQLDEIQHAVKRIEEGQMDDRFAKIEAGEKTLRLAYKSTDEKTRRELVANAVPMLQEGSEAIKKVIVRRLNGFEQIPAKSGRLKLKMWMSPTNYVDRKNKEFDEIQTCFEYYDRAQKLTAIACMMLEEPGAMEEVFFQQEKFIKSLETDKLRSIENIHYNIDFSGEWFYSPRRFLDDTRLQYLDFTKENYDIVSIEVTGKQMLEVFENDQTTGSEEGTAEE